MCAYIADVSSPSKRGAAMMNAGNYFMRKMSFINVSLFGSSEQGRLKQVQGFSCADAQCRREFFHVCVSQEM
jgi:hypothetical protein